MMAFHDLFSLKGNGGLLWKIVKRYPQISKMKLELAWNRRGKINTSVTDALRLTMDRIQ